MNKITTELKLYIHTTCIILAMIYLQKEGSEYGSDHDLHNYYNADIVFLISNIMEWIGV